MTAVLDDKGPITVEAVPFEWHSDNGRKVRLEPFEEADQQRLIDWVTSPITLALWASATFQFPLTQEQLTAHRLRAAGQAMPWTLLFRTVDVPTETVFGHIEISEIWPSLSARASRLLIGDEAMRSKGYGTALIEAVAEYSFHHLRVDRVDLGFKYDNAAARRAYMKAGFVPVGYWPQAVTTESFVIDSQWMSRFRQPRPRGT